VATIETPIISPLYGSYRESIDVTLRCATPNVAIYYTIDGSTPDATDSLYTDGTPIEVTSTITVKAIGILSGWTDSAVASSVFTVVSLTHRHKVKLKHVGAGEGFKSDLLANVACCDALDYKFRYGYNPDLISASESVNIEVYEGCTPFDWEVSGSDYSFANAQTAGRINVLTAIADPSDAPATITVTDACSEEVTGNVNKIALIVSPVNISPNTGTYEYYPVITLTTGTDGATIYYTIDGSTPNSASTEYTGTFSIYENITIKAIAIKNGYLDSPITNATFVIDFTFSLLIHSNTTNGSKVFVDSSPSEHVIPMVGFAMADTHHDTTQKKFGTTSIYFDGTGDRLTCADHDDWAFGSGNFTVEFWWWPTNYAYSNINFGVWNASAGSLNRSWLIYGKNTIGFAYGVGVNATSNPGVTVCDYNAWSHVSVVRSLTKIKTYINGTEDLDISVGTAEFNDANHANINLFMSYYNGIAADTKFLGYVDEIMISKGSAIRRSDFEVPTSPYS